MTHPVAVPRGASVRRRPRINAELVVVFAAGLAVRLALIPVTRGQDFVVWDRATAATLRWTNIYAHHPHYPGGPYAYFPLFLYIELPFQWLAQHAAVSFTVLGKLPVLAADLGTAALIVAELRERGCRPRVVALGAAAFLLNPLVIYNSAYYGRFDSIGCALLLLAVRGLRRSTRGSRTWYALAVAAKTFPVFLLPAVLRAQGGRRLRTLLVLGTAIVVVSLPYLATWHAYVRDIVWYDATKTPQALSWQRLLLDVTDKDEARLISYLFLAVFALGAVGLSRRVSLDRSVALTLVLFLLCSKVVLDQYLTWPLPWLILASLAPPRRVARASAGLAGVLTLVGMFANATIHPWGRTAWWLEVGLAVACAGYLLIAVHNTEPPVGFEPTTYRLQGGTRPPMCARPGLPGSPGLGSSDSASIN
jgi:hypothetical protein